METRVCECCGRELPVDSFIRRMYGMSKICKSCNAQKILDAKRKKKETANLIEQLEAAKSLRLQDFAPRELIAELARRGYRGNISYTETRTIDLSTFSTF